MKKLVLLMLLIFATTVQARDWTTWVLGNDDEIGVRVGYEVAENAEAGMVTYWSPDNNHPQIWGAYGLYFFPDLVEIQNPLPVLFLPEKFVGKGYFGLQIGVNFDNDNTFAVPVAGILFNEVLSLEYQYYDNEFRRSLEDEHVLKLAVRFRF